jgi:cellulose synthase/poly-beta-1,6-N-acetylglucosamine synthase-like glycosyltransferase
MNRVKRSTTGWRKSSASNDAKNLEMDGARVRDQALESGQAVSANIDPGPGKIIVIVPAHNEELLIGAALDSLTMQTRPPDEVIVVLDQCDDNTGPIVASRGISCRLSIQNEGSKAGAINQVLDELLPRLTDNDAVLLMDADTCLSPQFLSESAWRLREPDGPRARVGAVGGIFFGQSARGIVGHLQDNEYVRYARELDRRKGRADVLTGTATLFSVRAMRAVERARSEGLVPPATGVYGVDSLTEDNELTLAFKHVGYRCVSPKACTVVTELMPTAKRLFYQRLRWQRGALQNLAQYGLTQTTVPYILRQVLTYATIAFVPFFFTTLLFSWITTGSLDLPWFWLAVTVFIIAERVWSVKSGGWRSVVLSALVVPEVLFDFFLHVVYLAAVAQAVLRDRGTWDPVTHPLASNAPAHQRADRFSRLRFRWNYRAPLLLAAALLFVVGLALDAGILRLGWPIASVWVLTGAALAALRLSRLDPFGRMLGTGEPATPQPAAGALPEGEWEGFGGPDVPRGAAARLGGDGRHHRLAGGGLRTARVASSAQAQASRQATAKWLAQDRQQATVSFARAWGGPIDAQ